MVQLNDSYKVQSCLERFIATNALQSDLRSNRAKNLTGGDHKRVVTSTAVAAFPFDQGYFFFAGLVSNDFV